MKKTKKIDVKVEKWQVELDKVGFVRKLFMARKWYGGDWWFILISAIVLLFVIIVGVFPGVFAPYDPTEEVAPSFLAPGEPPAGYQLIVKADSGYKGLADIINQEQAALKLNNLGYLLATQASQAIREAVDTLNAEAPEANVYHYRPKRCELIDECLTALDGGEIS
jgi:hypothetical protein